MQVILGLGASTRQFQVSAVMWMILRFNNKFKKMTNSTKVQNR